MTSPAAKDANTSNLHHMGEDAAAIFNGSLLMALAIVILKQAGLLAGGLSGLALLISYATAYEVWLVLLVLNLPFLALMIMRMGVKASVRSAIAMALIPLFVRLNADWLAIAHMQLYYAALVAGVIIGFALLALFRHRTTVGGFGVVAVIAQERFGLRAGYVQMAIDVAIVLASAAYLDVAHVIASALAAIVLNLILAINHKPGRYLGMS